MKANEAPEKIWINSPQDLPCGFVDKNSVEYVRANTFIEKACEYIKEHLFDYWSQSVTNESKFIEDFKKYMKGE